MNIGVLGTGMVGQTIAGKVSELGHEVMVGTRDVTALAGRSARNYGQAFSAWHQHYPSVQVGTYTDVAAFGEILFLCVGGRHSIDTLTLAGEDRLKGKVVVDITNPVDFSEGNPSMFVCNTDSLGEQIQRAFPNVHVVKSLNSVAAPLMVNACLVAEGDHHMFVAGNDAAAKTQVIDILKNWFSWKQVLDLGDISAARGMESILLLWPRLVGVTGTYLCNFKIVQ